MDPNPNPDHGTNVIGPANGVQREPARPDNIPKDFSNLSWHIIVASKTSGSYIAGATVKLKITAQSPNAVGGNVHGGYPFQLQTYVPYTHTIWYQPGVRVNTTMAAIIFPPLENAEIDCFATSGGADLESTDLDPTDVSCLVDLFHS